MTYVMVIMDYEHDYEIRHYLNAWKTLDTVYLLHSDIARLKKAGLSIPEIRDHITRTVEDSDAFLVVAGPWSNEECEETESIGNINWLNYTLRVAMSKNVSMRGLKMHSYCQIPKQIKHRRQLKWRLLSPSNYEKSLKEVLEDIA